MPPTRVVNWVEQAVDVTQRLQSEQRRRRQGASALQALDGHVHSDIATGDTGMDNGRQALRLHYRCLAAFDKVGRARTEYQREFQLAFTRASVYAFFGTATDANLSAVARENNWKLPIKQEAAITMPRRYGKTEACGQWLAAGLLSMRNRRFAIFAPGKRQAVMLLDVVKENLDRLTEYLGIRVVKLKDNETALFVRLEDGSINRLQAYPCKINIRIPAWAGGRVRACLALAGCPSGSGPAAGYVCRYV